ncbi:MAG TPA: prepilin peptidase [Hyphomicrobiaceae bacterium]|nr:prepilin peptidase [Hyphomicrobiaceae bacterium]
MLEYLLLLIFPAAMAFAGAMDLLTMTIPNRIPLALAATFLVAAPLAGLPLDAALTHLGAGALVLTGGILMFALGWLGGGDAKLLAAAALWVGLDDLVLYLTQVAILGGILALAIIAYRRLPVAALPGPHWALRLHESGTGMPYGLAIAGAGLWIYPKTAWFAAFAV